MCSNIEILDFYQNFQVFKLMDKGLYARGLYTRAFLYVSMSRNAVVSSAVGYSDDLDDKK